MKSIIKGFFLVSLICSLLVGCKSEEQDMKTIKHLDGTSIEVQQKIEKIGAVYGPSYEALVVLGQEDKIVVCSDVQFKNFSWAKKVFKSINKLPFIENVHSSVSVEEVMKYKPDMVISFPRPNELKQFEKVKISTVSGVTTRTLEDTKDLLMVYAEAIDDDAILNAKKYGDYFDEKVKMVKNITDDIEIQARPKVYYSGMDMLTTYGKHSDICELIETAGGRAVTEDLDGGNRIQINFEQLAAWNPDHIFIDHGGIDDRNTVEDILESAYSNKRYAAIKAVKNKDVHLSPSGVFYWDMGLQKILLLMNMAKTIHPEQFKDLNMEQEVISFYDQFFDHKLTQEEAKKILLRQDP